MTTFIRTITAAPNGAPRGAWLGRTGDPAGVAAVRLAGTDATAQAPQHSPL